MSASFNYALVVLEIIKEIQTIQNTRTEIKLLQFKDLELLKINQQVPGSLNTMELLLFCWQSLRENGCLLSSRTTTRWRQYPGINGHKRRDFGIYVLYIPRYPVSVSNGWFKLLGKKGILNIKVWSRSNYSWCKMYEWSKLWYKNKI